MSTTTKRSPGRPIDPELADRRRNEILDVAIRVFAKSGFAGTDVQVIADEVGVGKGTVYRYFATKEDLFLASADAGMTQLQNSIFAAVDGVEDDIEFILTACDAYVRFFQKRPELVEILIQERARFRDAIPSTHLVYREKNRGVFEERLQRAIDAGVLRQVSARDLATSLANLLYGTVVCGCLEGSTKDLLRTAQAAVDMFLKGVLSNRA